MSEPLDVTTPEAGISQLLLNRPAVHNAVNGELVDALRERVHALRASGDLRAIVLGSTTPGRFCGGADTGVPDTERRRVSDELYRLYEQLVTLPVPVVAAVDGAAVGGGAQLALAADVRLGSNQARFRFAGPGHGLAVGVWALPSTLGRRALELVLSQRFVAADEAASLGLLDRQIEDPMSEALAIARTVAGLDPSAVQRAKEHVVVGEHLVERLSRERDGNHAVFTGSLGGIPEQ